MVTEKQELNPPKCRWNPVHRHLFTTAEIVQVHVSLYASSACLRRHCGTARHDPVKLGGGTLLHLKLAGFCKLQINTILYGFEIQTASV